MIAACPKCQTRYRLRLEQIGERGVRLRCRRCEALFRVLPPGTAQPQSPPFPEASTAAREASPRLPSPADPAPQIAPAIVVAHRDAGFAKRIAGALSIEGQLAVAAVDGAHALLLLHRSPPKVAILDALLPGLDGHQICEVIKRNDALCEIPVVVIQGAGASPPDASAEGFGADLYLEPADGDAALESIREPLVAWGLRVPRRAPEPRESAPAPVPQPIPAGPEASVPAAASAPAADAGGIGEAGEFADELARAERLARIAVSDIVLYNEEKFAAALQSEDPLQTMRDELEEGRALLRGRIAQEVFAQRDFVGDELARVARERA